MTDGELMREDGSCLPSEVLNQIEIKNLILKLAHSNDLIL